METIEHPLFGRLVRDRWGDYVTLREFAYLPEFARSDRAPADEDLPLIADWRRHIPHLARRVRESPLRGGLHRHGIFEVYVDVDDHGSPSTEQVAAFAEFVAHEQEVCDNVVNAMLRYYQAIRPYLPPSNDVDFPEAPGVAALASILEFDCLTVPSRVVAGYSPLRFSWRPAWDVEHGLRALVYRRQVLMVGTDEVSDMESWPSDECFNPVWNRSAMTPAEVASYESYRSG